MSKKENYAGSKTEQKIQHIRNENLYLSRSILLEETGSSKIVKQIILFTIAVILAILVWISIMKVDEVAIASGELIPHGELTRIQHLFGGKVLTIHVEEGELVSEGDTLFQIDAENAAVTLQEVAVRKEVLLASKLRLEALLQKKDVDFAPLKEKVQKQIIDDQKKIYLENIQTAVSGRNVIIKQIEQTAAQIKELDVERKNLQKKLAILEKEEKLRDDLLKKGLNSKIAYMELEKELSDVEGRIAQMIPQKTALKARLSELEETRKQYDSQLKSGFTSELAQINSELITIEKSLNFHNNTVNYLTILSPIDGYIHNLNIMKIGEIVPPGVTLMEIVPKDRDMEAEIRISSQDIGHVRTGQEVVMKLTTYNFRRYGGITGELRKISQSAYLDKNSGQSYYRGVVHVDDETIKENNSEKILLPGMTLTAEIKTGKKSLLEYLLKPIYMSAYEAFRER